MRTFAKQLALHAAHGAAQALDAVLDLVRKPLAPVLTHAVCLFAPTRVFPLVITALREIRHYIMRAA